MANIASDTITLPESKVTSIPKDSQDFYNSQEQRALRPKEEFAKELNQGVNSGGLLRDDAQQMQDSAMGMHQDQATQQALNNRSEQSYGRSLNQIIQESGQQAEQHRANALSTGLKVRQAQQDFALQSQGMAAHSDFRKQSEQLELQKISQLRQQQLVDVERMKQQKIDLENEYRRQLKEQQRSSTIAGILGIVGTVGGAAAGTLLAGPAGGMAGASAGGALGGALGK